MILKKLSWKVFLPLLVLFAITSCNNEDGFLTDLTDYDALLTEIRGMTSEEYTADLAELDFRSENEELMQRFRGKRNCFEFVFPVTIVFPDGETQEVDSDEAFRTAMREWKAGNPEADARPTIQMPFNVIVDDGSEDGLVVTIETEEQFRAIHQDCFEKRPHLPKFRLCFEPVFPITIGFPDDSTVDVEDIESLKSLLREWKENNPDAEVRPEIVFPIEIVTDEGVTVEVADMEALREMLKDCVEKMKKHRKKGRPGGKGGDKGGKG